jgi:cytochrome c-type biogenesis protein CcmH/NrfG
VQETDTYYRLASALDVARLRGVVSENKKPEEIGEQVRQLLGQAVQSAQKATTLDPYDARNWTSLADAYRAAVPLGVEGALGSAEKALDRALELRPASADIHLAKALVFRADKKNEEAYKEVSKALELRPSYLPAIFLLAQIQLERGAVADALKSVEAATYFEPENPIVYFQLGLLQYGAHDLSSAKGSFEKALILDPAYANARYFLSLTLWREGDLPRALANMEKVQETNSESTEVARFLEDMRAGREYRETNKDDLATSLEEQSATSTHSDADLLAE